MATTSDEKWISKYWRPAAAWVYLFICLFDFVIMPIWVLRTNVRIDDIVEISMRLRPEDQLNAIVQLARKTTWSPITLGDSGMFHISFGAILGVAAYTRGRVQEAQVRNSLPNNNGESAQPPPRPPRGTARS